MGFIKKFHQSQKTIDELAQKDFESRAKQFNEEYKVLVRRYRCDFRAILDFVEGGAGGMFPHIKIADATEMVEKEEKAEREKEEIKEEGEKK